MTLLKRNAGLVLLPLIASLSSAVLAKGEVTEIVTELRAATPMTTLYAFDGKNYQWGVGQEVILKSINVGGELLPYDKVKPDAVVIRRVANSEATGKPCAVFVETMGEGDDYSFQASYPGNETTGDCDYGAVISSDVINIGSLDLFANAERQASVKNIERVDLVFNNGLVAKADAMDKTGFAVLEKHGNNHVQIAAITELDKDGNPKAYGPLIMVQPSEYADSSAIRYGLVKNGGYISTKRYAFLSNKNAAPHGYLIERKVDVEPMGVAFVSAADLGLTAEQTYYGISLFGADVNPNVSNLVDPRTFPLDTGVENPDVALESGEFAKNAGDADLIVGSVGDIVVAKAADGGDGTASGSGTPSNVAQDTETKEVLDVVETDSGVSASSSGGGSMGLPALFAMLLAAGGFVSRRLPHVVTGQQRG